MTRTWSPTRFLSLSSLCVLCVLCGAVSVSSSESAPSPSLSPASPPAASELTRRRAELAGRIGDGVVIIEAGGEDGTRVRTDFVYLTGLEVAGARLVLPVKDGKGAAWLFLPARDPAWELWNGPRPAPGAESRALTGVDDALPLADYAARLERVLARGSPVYLAPVYSGARAADPRAAAAVVGLKPGQPVRSYASALAGLREVKSAWEIERLREAIAMTAHGVAAGAARARPGAWEFQVQGAIEGGFMEWGSSRVGFPSIVGSGPMACFLHYCQNKRRILDGELVVMDVGATSAGYTADITRTVPASGKFTERQRELYELVLAAQAAGIAAVRPGQTLAAVHGAAYGVLDRAGHGAHFPHVTSHHVGLDVHDPSTARVLAPGMVITVEPGVYIPEEKVGIRIEDMVLVTTDGAEVLSRDIPKSCADIEQWIAAGRREH